MVALRKESVDRNFIGGVNRTINIMSLSARRAWIEISRAASCQQRSHVALRKESVDRNQVCIVARGLLQRRSPQGERG